MMLDRNKHKDEKNKPGKKQEGAKITNDGIHQDPLGHL